MAFPTHKFDLPTGHWCTATFDVQTQTCCLSHRVSRVIQSYSHTIQLSHFDLRLPLLDVERRLMLRFEIA